MNDPLILAEPNDPASRSVPLSAGSEPWRGQHDLIAIGLDL